VQHLDVRCVGGQRLPQLDLGQALRDVQHLQAAAGLKVEAARGVAVAGRQLQQIRGQALTSPACARQQPPPSTQPQEPSSSSHPPSAHPCPSAALPCARRLTAGLLASIPAGTHAGQYSMSVPCLFPQTPWHAIQASQSCIRAGRIGQSSAGPGSAGQGTAMSLHGNKQGRAHSHGRAQSHSRQADKHTP
jgi:hypothetical protein